VRYLGLVVGILFLGAGAILIGGHMISSAIKGRNKNE
jgi:hypothetical protein